MAESTIAKTPLPVFSLQCHAHIEFALTCLATFVKHCRDSVELTIHDDGSLTAEDCDRFRETLGPIRIISRTEADDLVMPKLAGKPKCQQYRRDHPFGLKLLDPPLISGGSFLLCDGDIVFVRDFEKLDRRSEPDEDLVHMKDWTTFYIYPTFSRFFGPHRTRMPDYVNAGLLYGTQRAFDLDYVESYISNPGFDNHHGLAEQTTWAALAGRCRSRFFDPSQVAFPPASFEVGPEWVALHFIGPIRYLAKEPGYLENILTRSAQSPGEGPAIIRTKPSIYYNVAQDVIRRAYRKLRPSYIRLALNNGPIPIAR